MSDITPCWGEYYVDKKTQQPFCYRPFHTGQQAIWDNEARFQFMILGKGGGKSSFAYFWLERKIEKNPTGSNILFVPIHTTD